LLAAVLYMLFLLFLPLLIAPVDELVAVGLLIDALLHEHLQLELLVRQGCKE
jgi:hypothetical protein